MRWLRWQRHQNQTWWPMGNYWEQHGRRKEPTPTWYPLTFTCTLWHTPTQKHTRNENAILENKKESGKTFLLGWSLHTDQGASACQIRSLQHFTDSYQTHSASTYPEQSAGLRHWLFLPGSGGACLQCQHQGVQGQYGLQSYTEKFPQHPQKE